jgi:hypothetical protein
MPRFRVEDLLVNIVAGSPPQTFQGCGSPVTFVIACGDGPTLVGPPTLVGFQPTTFQGCGSPVTFVIACGNGPTRVAPPTLVGCNNGMTFCVGGTLIAGCDAGCTLGTCSNACTYCSDACSRKATCEVNKTTLVVAHEEERAELDALRQQLRAALVAVDEREESLRAEQEMSDLDEVTRVEQSLAATLDEVRRRKAELEGQDRREP